MQFVYGFLRMAAFYVAFGIPYAIHGGHLHVAWQPAQVLMQFSFYALAIIFYASFKKPQTEFDYKRLQVAGKVGLLLSIIVPTIGSFAHTMGFLDQVLLDQGLETVGHSLGSTSVAVLSAVIIYCSFFPAFAVPKQVDKLNEEKTVLRAAA
jgi:hypothetical protein